MALGKNVFLRTERRSGGGDGDGWIGAATGRSETAGRTGWKSHGETILIKSLDEYIRNTIQSDIKVKYRVKI